MAGESRGTVLIWVVAAVLAAVALMRLTGSDGGGEAGGTPVRVDRAPREAVSAAGADVYVHVAGAVRRPGIVTVPPGSRVAAAVARAGGPSRRADLTGVNLAAQVEDGQQVVVPAAGAVPGGAVPGGAVPGGAVTPGAAAPAGAKPSLGTATLEQLDAIDGIGPTLAERIIEYRTENGGFGSLDELQDVDGIGEKRLETLREALQP
jgi:competence protein ComEA